MYGRTAAAPQNETTPFNPISPYAISKLAGFHLAKMYREAYGLHASSGILFNHESPRRSEEFVVRKITKAAALIKLGRAKELRLGSLDARRDWGFAKDYVDAMWRMLQQAEPGDYAIGTGESHSVQEVAALAFGELGLEWQDYIVTDPAYARPIEIAEVRADYSKAQQELGWEPRTRFKELIVMMVNADLAALSGQA